MQKPRFAGSKIRKSSDRLPFCHGPPTNPNLRLTTVVFLLLCGTYSGLSQGGLPLWTNGFGTIYSDGAVAVAAGNNGNVFVSGNSPGTNGAAECVTDGGFTNLPGATSPYTNSTSSLRQFFRLISK